MALMSEGATDWFMRISLSGRPRLCHTDRDLRVLFITTVTSASLVCQCHNVVTLLCLRYDMMYVGLIGLYSSPRNIVIYGRLLIAFANGTSKGSVSS